MTAKYDGRLPDENINLPVSHPLKDAATLLFGIAAIFVVAYFFLGWAAEKAVVNMSYETERKLLKPFESALSEMSSTSTSSPEFQRVDALFQRVAKQWENAPYKFVLRITDGPPNAFAFPGGGVVVTKGLLEEIRSENELAFILGHELGHFKNRDHLVGLSRTAVSLLFTWATFNMANIGDSTSDFAGFINSISDRSAGRSRELAADEFGLELLNKTFGHIDDAERFFERRQKDEAARGLSTPKYFSTHPVSEARIQKMKKLADKRGYVTTGTVTPW